MAVVNNTQSNPQWRTKRIANLVINGRTVGLVSLYNNAVEDHVFEQVKGEEKLAKLISMAEFIPAQESEKLDLEL